MSVCLWRNRSMFWFDCLWNLVYIFVHRLLKDWTRRSSLVVQWVGDLALSLQWLGLLLCMGSILGLGTSTCHGQGQKKRSKKSINNLFFSRWGKRKVQCQTANQKESQASNLVLLIWEKPLISCFRKGKLYYDQNFLKVCAQNFSWLGYFIDNSFFFLFFFFFPCFLGPHLSIWKLQARCLMELQLLAYTTATATSVAYATAHGNTRSLTHWAGPRIEPTS